MDNGNLPLSRLLPNIITLFGLCAGLTAIKLTFAARWEPAVLFIVIAALFDFMDGKVARFLRTSSVFGMQLDSLADSLNFGVAPALLLYFWSLHKSALFGWAVTMAFVICMVIRLARFNTMLTTTRNTWKERIFFVGLSAPIGALLALLPIMLSFYLKDGLAVLYKKWLTNFNLIIYVTIIAFLAVSRIPTFSLKYLKVPSKLDSIIIFITVLIVILLLTKPWLVLSITGILYIFSIPVSAITYLYLLFKDERFKG